MPTAPVEYIPDETMHKSLDRDFDVPAQALFHTMFGDMSPLFHALYEERRAQSESSDTSSRAETNRILTSSCGKDIDQGAWAKLEDGKMRRRFAYNVGYIDIWGTHKISLTTDLFMLRGC